MSTTPTPNLPPLPTFFDWEAFRREGHKVVDFIADYHKQLQSREIPVHPTIATGAGFLPKAMGLVKEDKAEGNDNKNTITPPLPLQPQSFDTTLQQIKQGVVPGMLHWQHPDFFGYFPSQLGPSAMLGEMIGTAMNTPGFSWASAPSASEMENLVMKWIVEMFGLPKDMSFEGTGGAVLQPSATEAAIVAILAAKNKQTSAMGATAVEDRMAVAGKLVAYVSDQAHFCIEKAAKVLGIPYFRKIASVVDDNFCFVGNRKMDTDALAAAIAADTANGLIPFFVSANFGATGICAIDDIATIATTITGPNKLWLNIDGAYAGVVAMLPEFREMTKVFGFADSLFINASKWMATMFNATLFFFKERGPIVSSLNATGVYLDNEFTASGAVVDYKDYHLGLGRPFRSIKLYTTLQSVGVEGLSNGLRRHIQLAKYLLGKLKERNNNTVVTGTPTTTEVEGPLAFPIDPLFGLVCFTINNKMTTTSATNTPNSTITTPTTNTIDPLELLKRLNNTNKLFAVHTVLEGGVVVFRIALSYPNLEVGDMDRLVDVIFGEVEAMLKVAQ